MLRILLGGLLHEANSFNPRAAVMSDFESEQVLRGNELIREWQATRTEQAGVLSVLSSEPNVSVVPTFFARGISGGPIRDDVYRSLLDELLSRIQSSLPCDGVLLVLHGSMMSESEPDATADVLERVRAIVGPDVPIVGTLDLHANVTERMLEPATALIGYHTSPHIDMYETGQKAAQVLMSVIGGELNPTTSLVRIPMLIPPENRTHMWGPLADLINRAVELEESKMIVHGSIYPVQPWMDVGDVASSVMVVTNDDPGCARETAQSLAEEFWASRHQFSSALVPPDGAISQALAHGGGTIILCDSADSTTSGSTGDSTAILAALLRAIPFDGVALTNIVDPDVVSQAIEAGVGATIEVTVGGTRGPRFFHPVTLHGYVKTISDGVFRFKGPGMHGVSHSMGRAVVLICGGVHLVVMERAVSQWDPELYRSVGEEPADARMVQVKSPMVFRAGYAGIFDDVIFVAAPGAANPDLATLPWQRLPRPIYPLDPEMTWP